MFSLLVVGYTQNINQVLDLEARLKERAKQTPANYIEVGASLLPCNHYFVRQHYPTV